MTTTATPTTATPGESAVTLHRGSLPLLISMPHTGTEIPPELQPAYVPQALDVEDTDWHLGRLYGFAMALGASTLQPRYSRYVIDLNRPPDDTPMYPGAANTELCPTRFFTGEPLYQPGGAPSADEQQRRRRLYWQPYHDALAAELARLKSIHGFALLWDAHSIRSVLPWLFEGKLPDLNIGNASDASADASITAAMAQACQPQPAFSVAVNGRFKGGYITRQYGRPADHVHAVQLEMCQVLYMREAPPYDYDEALAARVQPLVERMVRAALAAAEAVHGR